MLTFDAALTSALANANTTAFYVLKLYYNDESAFIGLSDRHRQDGTDIYYGIVTNFGNYTQSLDFFNFTTSTGNMSVTLINSEKSIKGGRFSDLLANNNFANRKWELFLNANNTTTLDTAARMIASGIISGEISYDENNITLTLLDKSSKYHKRIPTNLVDSTNYPNAPSNNIGKPVPVAYGDFYEKTDIGTIPTAHFDRYSQFYKNAFPAIITDKYNINGETSKAKADTQALNTTDNENLYFYKSGFYPTFLDTCDATTNNPVLEFSGVTASVYIPLSNSDQGTGTVTGSGSVSNGGNAIDGSFSTLTTMTAEGSETENSNVLIDYAVPKVNKFGKGTAVSMLTKYGDIPQVSGSGFSFFVLGGTIATNSLADDAEVKISVASLYSDDKIETFDFEGNIRYQVFSQTEDEVLEIVENGLVIDFTLEEIDSLSVVETFERLIPSTRGQGLEANVWDGGEKFVTSQRTLSNISPSNIDYIYYSGKGRQYGAYIIADSRSNGYSVSALIENPIFIIESILRSELGTNYTGNATATTSNKLVDSNAAFLTSVVGQTVYNIKDKTSTMVTARDSGTTLSLSTNTMANTEGYVIGGLTSDEIDVASFDASGNTTNGHLKDIYDDAMADIKFAFSQYKFIDSKDMIERLGRLCFSYIFISGNGKFKIETLREYGDYTAARRTIDYNDITLNKIGKTSLGFVKNSVLVRYNHDYGTKQNKSEATATDATSQGTTVNGFNETMQYEIEANEIVDATTAGKLATAYMKFMKDRKDTIDFNCVRPKYNNLEIGDVIDFSNWDSNLQLYGTAMSGFYIIQKISKSLTGCSINAIRVT